MVPDWKLLVPHRPVEPGAPGYVRPPDGTGERIAKWIAAGGSTVLLGGPVGVGKSTELAHAASLLQATHVACLVPLDRYANMRKITADEARIVIAKRVAEVALEGRNAFTSELLRQALSGLTSSLRAVSVAGLNVELAAPKERPPAEVLDLTLREAERLSSGRRLCLLLDGLEKSPESVGRDIFDVFAEVADFVDIVTTIPWHTTFGPTADLVVRPGERLEMVRPPVVEGKEGESGRWFLADILKARLGASVPPQVEPLVLEAATWSGGIPRSFLQILSAAGTFARLRRDADWPDATDLADSVAGQQDSYRRVLLPGDTAAIHAAVGTDGREMALDRKVRLMSHGVLLERVRSGSPVLEVHPLARNALAEGVRG